MEELEGMQESPSPKTVSSSRLSNMSSEEVFQESDPKESLPKKRSSSKRKTRNADRENGDVNPSTNGELHANEGKIISQNGDASDAREENAVTSSENKHEENEPSRDASEDTPEGNETNGSAEKAIEDKSVNGDSHVRVSTTGSPKENTSNSEESSPKEAANESMTVDTEESFFTAETESIPTDKAEGEGVSPKDANNVGGNGSLDSESEKENGFEGFSEKELKLPIQTTEQTEKAESSKGFFGKWSFGLMSDKKEPETNGHSEDINTAELYFSSIRGRMPLSRASPVATIGENSRDSVIFRKDVKTPPFVRTLDDSFGVKSEPSRKKRAGSEDKKPNLRKFPAKRCLNADESDDKEESFLTNLPFTKRRRLEDDKARAGFLRSFLWSPFRKRSISDGEDVSTEKLEDKASASASTTAATSEVKPSWFRSPFWFWKRCNKEERES